jgi:hypothetical protein
MQFFGALGSSSFHFHRFLLNPEVLAKLEVLENLEVPMNPGATLNPWVLSVVNAVVWKPRT